jgi:tRNA A37 threonylcarbamoyladenosine synthetase subunit TsaC/SUA5/YrdC
MKYKGRSDAKFTLIASSLQQVEKYFPLTTVQKKLARPYWPGPLSIVVSKRFAIRVPNQTAARSLARRVGKPLIATSFNKSGEPEVYDLDSYMVETRDLASLPKKTLIVNIARLPKRKPSTVVEVQGEDIIIHRVGPIKNPHV